MKRLAILLAAAILSLSYAASAHAYWIWTPKSGKWVNPKTAGHDNPKDQFAYAKGLYDKALYDDAQREFKRLLKAFPKSFEASESQYYLGLIEEAQGDLYAAFLAYQKVIDKYPFSERIAEINEREFKIAEAFMNGAKRKALGVPLPVENPALEIFPKIVENSTYGPLAAKAQYKYGLLLKSLMRYYEAEEAFAKITSNYPESEWASAAQFQIASCREKVSKGPQYDQGATKEAKEKFQDFLKEHPDAVLSSDAERHIAQLNEKEAESNYNIGRFYERQKNYTSARIYYEDVMKAQPTSKWAVKSLERVRILEKMKK